MYTKFKVFVIWCKYLNMVLEIATVCLSDMFKDDWKPDTNSIIWLNALKLQSWLYLFKLHILFILHNSEYRKVLFDEQNKIKCSATVSVINLHFGQTVKYLHANSLPMTNMTVLQYGK